MGRAQSVPHAVTREWRPWAALACSFIALAAWVRQLPFWLLNSRAVTECLQSGQLNVLRPFVILTV